MPYLSLLPDQTSSSSMRNERWRSLPGEKIATQFFSVRHKHTTRLQPRLNLKLLIPVETITTTLEDAHKSVLIPCDTSARLLELLLMLDQHWQFARLRAPICLVSRTGKEMLSVVRSLVEWMGGSSSLEDDETGTATLKLRSVHACIIYRFLTCYLLLASQTPRILHLSFCPSSDVSVISNVI
jgi:hypothetical protein